MRTEQERMELIRKRTLEIRKKEKKRRQRIIDMGCAAACVLLIICLGMLMPQITAQTEGKRMDGVFGGAASIFGTNSAQGYIVMGIICFTNYYSIYYISETVCSRNCSWKCERIIIK